MSDTNNAMALTTVQLMKPTVKTGTFQTTGVQLSDAIGKGFLVANCAGTGTTSVITYKAQVSGDNSNWTDVGDAQTNSAVGASDCLVFPIDFLAVSAANLGANTYVRLSGAFASGNDSTTVSVTMHHFKRII